MLALWATGFVISLFVIPFLRSIESDIGDPYHSHVGSTDVLFVFAIFWFIVVPIFLIYLFFRLVYWLPLRLVKSLVYRRLYSKLSREKLAELYSTSILNTDKLKKRFDRYPNDKEYFKKTILENTISKGYFKKNTLEHTISDELLWFLGRRADLISEAERMDEHDKKVSEQHRINEDLRKEEKNKINNEFYDLIKK